MYLCPHALVLFMFIAPYHTFLHFLRCIPWQRRPQINKLSRRWGTQDTTGTHARENKDHSTIHIAREILLGSRNGSSSSFNDEWSSREWLYTDSKVAKRRRAFRIFFPAKEDRSIGYIEVNKKNSITFADAIVVCEIAKELELKENTRRILCLTAHDNVQMRAIMELRSQNIDLYTPRSLFSNFNSISKNTSMDATRIDPLNAAHEVNLGAADRSVSSNFSLRSPFPASNEQEIAVNTIWENFKNKRKYQTLMGATGTGKTFMAASTIARVQKPTLILVPNKVLAAQLYNELKEFLPNNAVEYFVSFYDFYLPESYKSASDTYIEKVTQINQDIDRMRHSATKSLIERKDCVVVSSISCIYGLGMPAHYAKEAIRLEVGAEMRINDLEAKLLSLSYEAIDPTESSSSNEVSRGFFQRVLENGKLKSILIGPSTDEFTVNAVFHIDPSTGASSVSKIIRTDREIDYSKTSILQRLKSAGVDPALNDVIDESVPVVENVVKTVSVGYMADFSEIQGPVSIDYITIYPASHHVVDSSDREEVWQRIEDELEERYEVLIKSGHTLEAERLRQRTEADLIMLRAIGTCKGIENYSRHIAGREAGAPSDCLLNFFGKDWLLVVDESHVTIPMVKGMFFGDHSRKVNLVKHGFRLPSAIDNRPLKAEEFWGLVDQVLFTSATPGKFEAISSQQSVFNIKEYVADDPISYIGEKAMQISPSSSKIDATKSQNVSYLDDDNQDDDILDLHTQKKKIASYSNEGTFGDTPWWDAEVIIRPTGIVDPIVEVRPSTNQVEDLLNEINKIVARRERVLVTCYTKRMSEDFSLFLQDKGYQSSYLHSDVKPMQRLEIIRSLRRGEIDILIGVNLLREGLNLPEVTLVAIMDADKEGFLRSDTALIQTIGRASRNVNGRAILYADRITGSMSRAIKETDRRRTIQLEHNVAQNIVPKSVYSTTTEDALLEIVEMNAKKGNGGTNTNSFDMNVITRRLQGGSSAYSNSPSDDAVMAFSYDEDDVTYVELSKLHDRADEMMLDASAKLQFELAVTYRDVRNGIKATMDKLKNDVAIGTSATAENNATIALAAT